MGLNASSANGLDLFVYVGVYNSLIVFQSYCDETSMRKRKRTCLPSSRSLGCQLIQRPDSACFPGGVLLCSRRPAYITILMSVVAILCFLFRHGTKMLGVYRRRYIIVTMVYNTVMGVTIKLNFRPGLHSYTCITTQLAMSM